MGRARLAEPLTRAEQRGDSDSATNYAGVAITSLIHDGDESGWSAWTMAGTVRAADDDKPRELGEVVMYIGVIHNIEDSSLWAKNLEEYDESSIPAGYDNPISYIANDTSKAFCLWTGPSIDGLRAWLDAATSAAHNDYWEVDPKALGTAGIPT